MIQLDGKEMRSMFGNSPRISVSSWDQDSGSLLISSTLTFNRGGTETEMKSSEEYTLSEEGNTLTVQRESTGFRGHRISTTLVYEKR